MLLNYNPNGWYIELEELVLTSEVVKLKHDNIYDVTIYTDQQKLNQLDPSLYSLTGFNQTLGSYDQLEFDSNYFQNNQGTTLYVEYYTVGDIVKAEHVNQRAEKYVELIAQEDITAGQVISLVNGKAQIQDKDNETAKDVVGIQIEDQLQNWPVRVQISGVYENSSLSLTIGEKIFVGSNGQITQHEPATGYVKVIGTAVDEDKIAVQLYGNIEELDTIYVRLSDYEDVDVLNKIKNVDGSDSGLDQDLLDGNHQSDFQSQIHTHTKTDITDFQHTHEKTDITDFQHTHTKEEITDFQHVHIKSDITDFQHEHSSQNINDQTNQNVANTIVKRDENGGFSQGTISQNLIGNQSSQSRLQTQRTISLSGDVTGQQDFDGSQNITIEQTVVDNSHTHDNTTITNVNQSTILGVVPIQNGGTNNDAYTTGKFLIYNGTKIISSTYDSSSFQSQSHNHDSSYVKLSDYEDQDVLTKIKNVDGQNSGLDQDLLDGQHQSAFQPASHTHSQSNITSGTLSVARGGTGQSSLTQNKLLIGNGTSQIYQPAELHWDNTNKRLGVNTSTPSYTLHVAGTIYGDSVYGAVYNDYQEYRIANEEVEPGYVAVLDKNGRLSKCRKDRQKNIVGIVSDVYGFQIGEVDGEINIPIQVAGRVLAYVEDCKCKLKTGEPLVQTKNGKLRKLRWYEKIILPWIQNQIVGYVDEIPEYDVWGSNNTRVNGRVWIRVR